MTEGSCVIEGGEWNVPQTLTGRHFDTLDEAVWQRLGVPLRVPGSRRGKPRVGYGLAGFVKVGAHGLHVIPKCFTLQADRDAWGRSVPAFLSLGRGLQSRDVFVAGPGAFSPANTLLPWWADYYAYTLSAALHGSPFLRYEEYEGALPYVRGRINWARQCREWASAGARAWCEFRRYQIDHALNRLLRWAAIRFMHISRSARALLGRCVEELHGVSDAPPRAQEIERIRIPGALRAYDEPFAVARGLFYAMYPTLAAGAVPASGFLVRMDRALEAFVDGIVHRVVAAARREGEDWQVRAQEQYPLARPEQPTGTTLYTRPDNVVWELAAGGGFERGVVIDAKYKGLARDPDRYRRPVASDVYQVFASCVARGWYRGLVISPAVTPLDAGSMRTWRIEGPAVADAFRPLKSAVVVGHLKVDLASLHDSKHVESIQTGLREYLNEALAEA